MKIGKQQDVRDCGLIVIQSFINYYFDKWVDIDFLKMQASYGPNGISLKNLEDIANKNNLNFDACEGDLESLIGLKNKELPIMILILENGIHHYVILKKISKKEVLILDPAQGERIIELNYLKEIYQNVAAFISKKSNKGIKEEKLSNKISGIINVKNYTIGLIISSFLATILSFTASFFIKIVFDYILPNQHKKLLILMFISFLWINIIRFINDYIKGYIIKKSQNSIEIDLNRYFFYKLRYSRLIDIFKLNNADLIRRMSYIESIANYQSTFTFVILSDIFTILTSTIALIWINYWLFLIVLLVAFISVIINFLYQNIIKQKFDKFMHVSLAKGVSDLDHILAIKELGNVDYKNFIASRQIQNYNKYKNEEYEIFKTTSSKNLVSNILVDNLNLIIVFVSSLFIFKNKMSSGTLMMFLTSTSFFLSPFNTIINLFLKYNIIKEQIKLLNFVFNFKEVEQFENGILVDKVNSISLQDATFYYEKNKNVLDINFFTIDQNIQIQGKNGAGKSTFLNIIANNFELSTGTLKINDIELKNLHLPYYKNNIFYSHPNIYLPETTIYDYVCLGNKELSTTLNQNLEKYKLTNLLSRMKIDLKTNMSNNGNNFSSGQRQMIIILRLFTKKFPLILLDEAFENLDVQATNEIFAALKDFQNQALFIEISHSKKFIFNNKEVQLEQINKIK
ncbi:Mbov_0121 family peptidase domain-containing ABC transporter [Mycoplasmopsis hyopharyngis]|uniref:Mbov_0121 family peptidase domain-containing ABC transporter n=1 Tax=Mycoplasmopsis hyopharyngis TaxID=29558 RepID=UPI0038730691